MTINIYNTETEELIETHENINSEQFNPEARTLHLSAGKGTMSIQFGDDVTIEVIPEEEASE